LLDVESPLWRTLSACRVGTHTYAVKLLKVTSPAKQVDNFIAKFDPPMAKLIRSVRRALRKRFPTAIELVYDNYNFFVIGYSPTERPTDYIVSLAANAKGVGLSFNHGASLPDPTKILIRRRKTESLHTPFEYRRAGEARSGSSAAHRD
jgi:hypothetical protein